MRISPIYSDGMIIERNRENIVEAVSKPGAEIEVIFDGESFAAKAGDDGKWSVKLSARPAGGPFTMTINDGEEVLTVSDIYVGDVILLAGQSNMELPVCRTLDLYKKDLEGVNYPQIRMFQLPKEASFGEPDEILRSGSWIKATLPAVMDFSAVGFYFAQKKFDEDGVPVGLVHAAVGGTHIEAFMSEEKVIEAGRMNRIRAVRAGRSLECTCLPNDSCKMCYEEIIERDKKPGFVEETVRAEMSDMMKWFEKLGRDDYGVRGNWQDHEWNEEELKDAFVVDVPSSWINIPLGKMKGSVWVQRTIDIPEEFAGKAAQLRLGTIVDADDTYVNGTLVGHTDYFYPPRRYDVPEGLLKAERNVITVRVIINNNVGEFKTEMPYCLKFGDDEISLEGKWFARIAAVEKPMGGQTFFFWHPTSLYNTMIYPVRNISFGAIFFYQGESNTRYPDDFEFLMVDMIDEFRSLFGEDTPFVFAELPDFEGETWEQPGDDGWNRMRRSQRRAAKARDNVEMVLMYDLGQRNEIHTQNKKLVGARFLEAYKKLQQ